MADPEVTEANVKESICKAGQFRWTEGYMPPKSYLAYIEREQLLGTPEQRRSAAVIV